MLTAEKEVIKLNEFILLMNKEGKAVICGNRKEAVEVEEYRGAKIVGRIETVLNILEVRELLKGSVVK